tara:strand:+ start:1156 stop:1374 length:219 start_codon:yes stop_codon:yes gene_type:complete
MIDWRDAPDELLKMADNEKKITHENDASVARVAAAKLLEFEQFAFYVAGQGCAGWCGGKGKCNACAARKVLR